MAGKCSLALNVPNGRAGLVYPATEYTTNGEPLVYTAVKMGHVDPTGARRSVRGGSSP